ncbi:apolipoprotein A-IV-like [Melanotaenia boesemani]|uniref:apolipoprotein A-IV-like n=1 Tax=Melanotaenia boesemani TaxID=1250792 RepID=UPI001C03D445|nr:apolipoprotein A-IV-like [Melanotaenia boesemani]
MCPAGQLEMDFTPEHGYKSCERSSVQHKLIGQRREQLHLKDPTACSPVMKVLVVLALFSVCNANILWQEPPKTNLDVVKEAFWDYVAKATLTAEDTMRQIQESELGQEVNTKISQSADAVNQYIVALRTQAAPLTQGFMTQFSQEAEQLKARLEKELAAMGASVQPQAEQLLAQLQSQVEELKKETAPYVEAMDPEALKALLVQKSQELKGQLEKSMSNLQTQMVPYTEEVKEKMEQSVEEFQKTVIPLVQSFETELAQKTQEIQQNLAPLGEELKAKLDSSTQDLQAQLAVLWEAFTKKTQ